MDGREREKCLEKKKVKEKCINGGLENTHHFT